MMLYTFLVSLTLSVAVTAYSPALPHRVNTFRTALDVATTPPTSKIFRYGSDVAIAEENLVLGNFKEAQKMAQEAVKIAEGLDNEEHSFKNVFIAFADGLLADALYNEGSYQEAADHYRMSLSKYEAAWQAVNQRSPEALEMVGATQLIASSLLDNEVDYDAAVRTCQLALGMTEKLMAPDSKMIAFSLIDLGRAYMLAGDTGEGPESLLNRAITLIKHPNDWNVEDGGDAIGKQINYESELHSQEALCRAYSQLGDLHTIRGDLDKAIEVYSTAVNDAMTLMEAEHGITEPESTDMIDILEKLSVLCYSRDELKKAEDLSRRALWSLELRLGSLEAAAESKKNPAASEGENWDPADLKQQIMDLKTLIAQIHSKRREEQENAVRNENAF